MASKDPSSNPKTPTDQGAVRDRFSHRTYVADFGSYEGNRRTEEPDNELLVGREAQRARLLNLLFNTAQRGAYLITGHRGSGKTTFVNYCLNEYRFEIFYRYLKSNLGRAFLWDRFGLVIFGVLLFLFGMLVHQSLAYLFLLPSRGILHWLAITILTLIACYPFVAAYERLKLISERLLELATLRAPKLEEDRRHARKLRKRQLEAESQTYLEDQAFTAFMEVSRNLADTLPRLSKGPTHYRSISIAKEMLDHLASSRAIDKADILVRTLTEAEMTVRGWLKAEVPGQHLRELLVKGFLKDLSQANKEAKTEKQMLDQLEKQVNSFLEYPNSKNAGELSSTLARLDEPNQMSTLIKAKSLAKKKAAREVLFQDLKSLYIQAKIYFKNFFQASAAVGRPSPVPFLTLFVIAGLSWTLVRAGHPAEFAAELVYCAGWLYFLVALAHPTFPRAQELHILGLLTIIGLDLLITNNYLEAHFPHTTEGFFVSGMFSGSLGLLLSAHHKHEAVQNWFRRRRRPDFHGQVPGNFIRQSYLNKIWPPFSNKGSEPPMSRASLMALYLLFLSLLFWLGALVVAILNRFLTNKLEPWKSPALSLTLLMLALLPVLLDLACLCLPTARYLSEEKRRKTELTQTAEAAIAAGRWYAWSGILLLSGTGIFVFLANLLFARQLGLLPLAAIKALILIVSCHTIYLVLRCFRGLGYLFGISDEKEEADGSKSTWRTQSRFRTRADAKNSRQELLQAAISGQHAQPLLLILAKSVFLVQVGLILVYPALASLQNPGPAKIFVVASKPYSVAGPGQRSCVGTSLCRTLQDRFGIDHRTTQGFEETASLYRRAENSTIDLFADLRKSKNQNIGKPQGFLGSIEWVLALLFLTLAIAYLEYEWILRGGQHVRPDRTLRHQTSEVRRAAGVAKDEAGDVSRAYQRRLLEQTLFWRVHQSWLPILTVPVNLGFDSLDHRRVVEAMLTGLRDAYHKLFFQWSSPTRLVATGGGLLMLSWISLSLGNHWFHVDESHQDRLAAGDFCRWIMPNDPSSAEVSAKIPTSTDSPLYLDFHTVKGTGNTPTEPSERQPSDPPEIDFAPGMQIACLGGEITARMVQWPLFLQVQPSTDGKISKVDFEKHYSGTVFGLFFPEVLAGGEMTLRLYHFLIFLALVGVSSWIGKRRPPLPYRRTLNEIELLLSQISSHQREELRYHPAIIPRLVGVFTGEDKVKHWESEPFDPRTIEISVLRILRDIQDPTVHFPYLARHRINLPTPEIIFKFDELDKLGIGVLPHHETTGPEVGETEQFDLERQRTRALHSLFADMKNLVSSGAARFIFVGGRNLHDEWLADQTARRPLLTNIFEVEIYLPSLLLAEGPVDSNAKNLTDGITTFVEAQYQHAIKRNRRALLHRYRPWLTPWLETPAEPIFVQVARKRLSDARLPTLIVRGVPLLEGRPPIGSDEKDQPRQWGNRDLPRWKNALINDFMEFLAYRSRGNVKRLKATLERFVEPSLKVLGDDLPVDCQHVLVFRDTDRFRIQLIAEIYRRILSAFDPRIRFYDDKLVVGLLYIADFLLKFHRRAFAWNSLQKVDELVHIHRAPELPNAISDLLHAWQQKYLHRIRNGMYDYRFNSDFAMELRYLSRRSDEELAALNFTLDESQALKALYRSRFSQLKDPSSYEFVAALGELHEFDGEYDVARYYYNRALSYLDEHFHMQVARKKDKPAFFSVMLQDQKGLEAVRRRIAWGIARLRLKMQIGMSYEQSNDLEQAQGHYRNARTLASAIMRALLNAKVVWDPAGLKELEFPRAPDYGAPDYVSTLKHLNLLFQPAFAEAWVSEKHTGGVDTSTRLIERSIWELRWRLPFVREEFDPKNVLRLFHNWVPAHDVLHLNFALIMAEQHNKVGDLLFFKGGVSFDHLSNLPPTHRTGSSHRAPIRHSGYLIRSRYHYALTLHELRFFNRARQLRWAENHGGSTPPEKNPVSPDEWGDFVFRATGGSIADFAETFLAATPSMELICCPPRQAYADQRILSQASLSKRVAAKKNHLGVLESTIRYWLSGIDRMPPGLMAAVSSLSTAIQNRGNRRSPLRRHLYDRSSRSSLHIPPKHPTPSTLSAEDWRNLVLRGVFNLDARAPKSPEVAGEHRPSARQTWGLPFERALRSWLGVATGKDNLWDELCSQESAPLDELVEKLVSNQAAAELPAHSTLSELQDLADGRVQNLIQLGSISDPLEMLSTYLVLTCAAARILEKGGFYEDAARKKLRILETVVQYLSWARIVCSLKTRIEQKSDPDRPRSDQTSAHELENWKSILKGQCPETSEQVINELFDLGWLLLQDAQTLYQRSRSEWNTKDNNEVGTRLPTQMFILGCSLGLAWIGLKEDPAIEDAQGEQTLLGALEQRIYNWVQNESTPCKGADVDEHRSWLRTQIIEILERNAYPLIGRLSGLKALVDDAVLNPPTERNGQPEERVREQRLGELWESCQHLSELLQLEDLYDGKWHFTPFQIGSTLALFTLQPDGILKEIDDLIKRQKDFDFNKGRRHDRMLPRIRDLREMARRHLIEGHEMYTMRRAYYRSINRLFYLHDDFNDRRIHYNHAVQMTAAEISQTFLAFLDLAIEEDDRKKMG